MTTAEGTQPAWASPGLIERVQRSEPLRSGSKVKIKDGRPSRKAVRLADELLERLLEKQQHQRKLWKMK